MIRAKATFEIIDFPNLPEPLAYSSAVVEDDFVYVVGGKIPRKASILFIGCPN
ncbi:hypothetical protein Q2T40_00205 [Winogradskyella maritima]|nr:hypothetical protein [Winogradskyella maritima]